MESTGLLSALLKPSWLRLILLVNAFVGLYIFELTWKKIERLRKPNKELDEFFPQFRRRDIEKLNKSHFYVGAMTMMIPRILWQFFLGASLTMFVKIILAGQPKEGVLGPRRKACLAFWYKLHVNLFSLFSHFTLLKHRVLSMKDVNHYQEYLGPKDSPVAESSRIPKRGPGKPSLVVSNHFGFVDVLTHICGPLFPGFTPKKEIINIPFGGVLTKGL